MAKWRQLMKITMEHSSIIKAYSATSDASWPTRIYPPHFLIQACLEFWSTRKLHSILKKLAKQSCQLWCQSGQVTLLQICMIEECLIWWTWWFVSKFVLTMTQSSKMWYCQSGFCGPGTTVHTGCNASDGSLVLSFLKISKGGCTLLKRNLSKATRMSWALTWQNWTLILLW